MTCHQLYPSIFVQSLFIPNTKGRYARKKSDLSILKSSYRSNRSMNGNVGGTCSKSSSPSVTTSCNENGTNRKKISKKRAERINSFSKNKNRQTTKRNLYLNGGYTYGDNKSLMEIFDICSNDKTKKLDWEYLDASRYLRFWPGKKDVAEDIWGEVCGDDGCSLETLLQFHTALDNEAALIYQGMEEERVQWDEENLISDLLEKYFTKACNKAGRLEFAQFMTWDVIKSEIWYGDLDDLPISDDDCKGNNYEDIGKDARPKGDDMNPTTEVHITNIWGKYADECDTVSYEDFRAIYECICSDKLTLYSSDFKSGMDMVVATDSDDDEEE